MAITLLIGAVVALFSILRTRSLEATAAIHLAGTEQHRPSCGQLSQKLSKAQEDERRSLSRELHDQVGQLLTAVEHGTRKSGGVSTMPPERDLPVIW